MSTLPKAQRHRQYRQPEGHAAHPPVRKRRRWRLAFAAVLLAALVWALPGLVAHTGLLRWAVGTATAKVNGTVTVRSASLGWFSPIVLSGIEVRDAQGKPLLQAVTLSSGKSLAALLWNLSALGQFRLEQPKLTVVLREDGSNIEDALSNYLAAKDKAKSPSKVGMSLEIVDGCFALRDQNAQQTWQIEKLGLSLDMPSGPSGPIKLRTSAVIADQQPPAKVAAELSIQPQDPTSQTTAGSNPWGSVGEVTVDAAQVPLPMFASLLGRLAPKSQLAGRLTAAVRGQWGDGKSAGKTAIHAQLSGEDLAFTSPSLGSDRIQLEHANAVCQFSGQGDQIDIEQSTLDCDLGNFALSGHLQLGNRGAGGMLDAALHQTYQASGRLDLARLANMLPNTLRVRKETQITSGQVEVELRSRQEAQGMIWQGRIEAGNVTAVARGRQLAWQHPILLLLNAHDTPQGPVIDGLDCDSEFLKLHAAGTPEDVAGSTSFDLKQLAGQLGQFVELGDIGLTGEGLGQFHWKRSPDKQFSAGGQFQLRDFQLVMPALDWRFAGGGELAAEATGSAERIDVRRASLTITPLKVASPWLNVDELRAELVAAGGWDRLKRRLQLDPATFTSSGLALQANGLVLSVPTNAPMEVSAQIKCWGDLQRLHQWLATGGASPAWRVAGEINGTAQLTHSAGRSGGQLEAQIDNLAVANPSGEHFQESQVRLAARGEYQHAAALLQLERVELSAGALGVNASGMIAPGAPPVVTHQPAALVSVGGQPAQIGPYNLDLKGQLSYDLEKVAVLLRPYLGAGIRLAGRGSSPASYHGPLDLAAADANAAVRWDAADLYGFPLGPAELRARLSGGTVVIDPLDLEVSQGHVLLAPRVTLAPEPKELLLPPGPLARQVQVTPAMCAAGLKYIAPVLADVTDARGAFSIELEGCRIPLSNPAKADMAGRLTVHSVEVGPGPLIREFAVLLGRETPAKLRRESVVPFRMVDGRVYHQGLELEFPELTIRTHGSVGLDQTLALVAEMPVPPKWLGNTTVGTALRDQTISLPVGGTLTKPELDRGAMEKYNRQLLQNAAKNVIEDEVGKQLDRLFGPPK